MNKYSQNKNSSDDPFDPIFEVEFYKLRMLKVELHEIGEDNPEFAEKLNFFKEFEKKFEERYIQINS